MYILDTDTLSHLHKGNFKVLRSLQQVHNREVMTTVFRFRHSELG